MINRILAWFNLQLIRKKGKPEAEPIPTHPDSEELKRVVSGYCEMHENQSWPEASGILNYLCDARLWHYEHTLELCVRSDLSFDGKVVGDFGTGMGYLLRRIHQRFPSASLHGCDLKTDDLAIARTLVPSAHLHQGGVEAFADSSLDLLFCTQVLEHLEEPEEFVINLLEKISEKNGKLILTVPDGRQDRLKAGEYYPEMKSYWGHINFWSKESWELFLKRIPQSRVIAADYSPTIGGLFAILERSKPS